MLYSVTSLTDDEFVSVSNLTLSHGQRYITCIHANETVKKYEHFEQRLPAVSMCSNGVTVDMTPPRPGLVWIGSSRGQHFQVNY